MANLNSSQAGPVDKHALVDECKAFRNNFHDPALYKDPISCCVDLINRVNSVLNSNPDEEDTRIFSKIRAVLLSVSNKLNDDSASEHSSSSGSTTIGRPATDPIGPIVGGKSKGDTNPVDNTDEFPPLPSKTLQSGNTGTADKTALQSPGSQKKEGPPNVDLDTIPLLILPERQVIRAETDTSIPRGQIEMRRRVLWVLCGQVLPRGRESRKNTRTCTWGKHRGIKLHAGGPDTGSTTRFGSPGRHALVLALPPTVILC